jgi:hypothetical protein
MMLHHLFVHRDSSTLFILISQAFDKVRRAFYWKSLINLDCHLPMLHGSRAAY